SPPPPHLPASPTRRSSDLRNQHAPDHTAADRERRGGTQRSIDSSTAANVGEGVHPAGDRCAGTARHRVVTPGSEALQRHRDPRRSEEHTSNSSHVKISYAV